MQTLYDRKQSLDHVTILTDITTPEELQDYLETAFGLKHVTVIEDGQQILVLPRPDSISGFIFDKGGEKHVCKA